MRGIAEAERFYCGALGCAVKHRMAHLGMVELTAGVALVDVADPSGAWALEGAGKGRNPDHFALQTSAWDEAEMGAWLAANGIEIEEVRSEEEEFSFSGRDPSGNLVELLQRKPQARPRR